MTHFDLPIFTVAQTETIKSGKTGLAQMKMRIKTGLLLARRDVLQAAFLLSGIGLLREHCLTEVHICLLKSLVEARLKLDRVRVFHS